MPLKIATVERQRTVSSLAKSLFAVRNDPELLKRAEEALVRANPALGGDGRLTAGTTVVVPDIRGLATTDDVRKAALRLPAIEDRDGARIAALIKTTEAFTAVAAEEAKAQRAELKARAFTAAFADAHPDLREALSGIAKAADAEADQAATRAAQLLDALKKVQADQARRDARGGLKPG